MIAPENHLSLNLRLFDVAHSLKEEIGKYDNIVVNDLNAGQLITDVRKSFNKIIKQLEIDIKNFKEGKL